MTLKAFARHWVANRLFPLRGYSLVSETTGTSAEFCPLKNNCKAVVLLGPRQVGKTTLAKKLSRSYYDLEQPEERLRLDRDLPNWGLPAKPQETMRFFRMLAISHGQLWNASEIGKSLGIT